MKDKYAKISPRALGVAFGIFWGVYMMLLAWFVSAGVSTVWFSQSVFDGIKAIYPWYAATGIGGIVGLITGFICGLICGVIIALLYNFVLEKYPCKECK